MERFVVAHIATLNSKVEIESALSGMAQDWQIEVCEGPKMNDGMQTFVVRGGKMSAGYQASVIDGIERAKARAVCELQKAQARGLVKIVALHPPWN